MKRALLFAALFVAAPRAQDGDEFATRYAAAERLRLSGKAEAGEVREAYARALQSWLQMPRASDAAQASVMPAAFAAWQAGDLRQARTLAEAAWELGPRDGAHLDLRLRVLLDADQPLLAARAARATEAEHWATAKPILAGAGTGDGRLLSAAGRWLASGDTDLARWTFEALARASDEHPVALGNLALALRHLGDEQRCEETYKKALAKAPNDEVLWNDYGLFLKGAGRHADAVTAFTRARALENPPGASPAIPNLVLLARATRRELGEDPHQALATVLSVRPDAAFPRWLALELLVHKP